MPNSRPRARLLVSVRSREEAIDALAGGADIIDVKEPAAGALGAASLATLQSIVGTIGTERPVSAALGDAVGHERLVRDVGEYTAAGAAFVKVGFGAVASPRAIEEMAAATTAAGHGQVIAVAYADHDHAGTVRPDVLLQLAARTGLAGILVDTANKSGPGLLQLASAEVIARWVDLARAHGLLLAVAGRLQPADLPVLCGAGVDVVGVRGAACEGGRLGRISRDRVRELRQLWDGGIEGARLYTRSIPASDARPS